MQHLQKTRGGGYSSHSGTYPPLSIHPSLQRLTHCQFCKPFLLMVFHLMGGVGGVMADQLAPLGLPGIRRGTAACRSDTERACCLNDASLLKNAVIGRRGGDGWLPVRNRGEIKIDRLAGDEWHTTPARGGRRSRTFQKYFAKGFLRFVPR